MKKSYKRLRMVGIDCAITIFTGLLSNCLNYYYYYFLISLTESLEIAKCVTESLYQEYLKCSDDTDARHRSPSKYMAPNQG